MSCGAVRGRGKCKVSSKSMWSDIPRVPQAHGVAWGVWIVHGTWDAWGPHMYALVGARCVKGGLGHGGEVQMCGWARTHAWMGWDMCVVGKTCIIMGRCSGGWQWGTSLLLCL